MRGSARIVPCVCLCVGLAAATASAQTCTAPASWFPHAQTPAPTNGAPGSDCAFHQWAWQTFLWMTQPVGGDLRFITQTFTPGQVFAPGGPLPAAQSVPKQRFTLRPRTSKEVAPKNLGGINQAGDRGVLVDPVTSRAVYYATHLNDVYFNFIRQNNFNDPQALENASPTLNFPVGTLEMKSAWRVVGPGDDTTGVYTTTADIELLTTNAAGKVVVDPTQVVTVKVALVGLHVVGVVENHPEFIWATFEPSSNAPQLPANVPPTSPNPVSGTASTFYLANTPANQCNVSNAGNVTLTNPTSQALSPVTNVFRQVAWGGGSAADVANIQALNASVHAQLGNEVWTNYNLIGGVWISGTLQPNVFPAPQQGSVRLANTTMETFAQGFGNCFSCHNTFPLSEGGANLGAKNINLSHALEQAFVTNEQLRKRAVYQRIPQPAPR